MDDSTFSHLFAIAQAAPGPNLLVVSLIGWQVAGIPGAIAATLGTCLPVSTIVFLLYRRSERMKGNSWQQAIETGIAPIAVGLVSTSGWFVVTSAGLDYRGVILTIVVTAIFLNKSCHPLYLLFAGGIAGALGLL